MPKNKNLKSLEEILNPLFPSNTKIKPPDPVPVHQQIAIELANNIGIKQYSNDMATLRTHVFKAFLNSGAEPLWYLIGNIKEEIKSGSAKNPIALTFYKLKSLQQ